jgi:hypothetical protein
MNESMNRREWCHFTEFPPYRRGNLDTLYPLSQWRREAGFQALLQKHRPRNCTTHPVLGRKEKYKTTKSRASSPTPSPSPQTPTSIPTFQTRDDRAGPSNDTNEPDVEKWRGVSRSSSSRTTIFVSVRSGHDSAVK